MLRSLGVHCNQGGERWGAQPPHRQRLQVVEVVERVVALGGGTQVAAEAVHSATVGHQRVVVVPYREVWQPAPGHERRVGRHPHGPGLGVARHHGRRDAPQANDRTQGGPAPLALPAAAGQRCHGVVHARRRRGRATWGDCRQRARPGARPRVKQPDVASQLSGRRPAPPAAVHDKASHGRRLKCRGCVAQAGARARRNACGLVHQLRPAPGAQVQHRHVTRAVLVAAVDVQAVAQHHGGVQVARRGLVTTTRFNQRPLPGAQLELP
mmetsp:Transcript_28533/g.73934  ORF Transcript_28533/g.73934 Transcript_28533/m.73934 type:complete len:267 (+) Transcript_28533:65-865(+)